MPPTGITGRDAAPGRIRAANGVSIPRTFVSQSEYAGFKFMEDAGRARVEEGET